MLVKINLKGLLQQIFDAIGGNIYFKMKPCPTRQLAVLQHTSLAGSKHKEITIILMWPHGKH